MRTIEPLSSRFAGVALLCATVFSTTACPECRYYNDCPSGQACSTDRVCVDIGTDPGTNTPPPPPPPNDGGTLDVERTITTEFPVGWLAKDTRNPNRGIFPQFFGNADVDSILTFDLATGARDTTTDLDLIGLGGAASPCEGDNLYQESGIPSQHGGDETWIICRRGAGVRIFFDDAFAQQGRDEEGPSEDGYVMTRIVSTGTDTNDFQRRVTFERGGSTLNVYQLNPTQDGVQNVRTKDTVSVTFNEITQVWQIPSIANTADLIVVFDAGADPKRLVPLSRSLGTTEWIVASSLPPMGFPAATHVLVPIGAIDPQGTSPADAPNILTIEPSTGFARFFSVNSASSLTPVAELFQTRFEQAGNFMLATPESKTRLLLEPAPGGGAVFYMHPLISRVWRIPFTPNAENDVTTYTIGGGGLTATGLVPSGAYTTWLSIPETVELIQVTLSVGG